MKLVSAPPRVWHDPVVGPSSDWVVVSFHSVPAEDLIEKQQDLSDTRLTNLRRCLDAGPRFGHGLAR